MQKSKQAFLLVTVCCMAIALTACGSGDAETSESEEHEQITSTELSLDYESARMPGRNSVLMAEYSYDIDGDEACFFVSGVEQDINFMGITCPDADTDTTIAKPWGPEAQLYTENALSNAKSIYVEYGDSSTNVYGEKEAWIWVDGHLLQELLLKEGLAEGTMVAGSSQYSEALTGAQNYAKANEIGIWGPW